MGKRKIAHLLCRWFGHNWAGISALEHICTTDWCFRCWDTRIVHLWGPWPHTCEEKTDGNR